MTQYRASWNKQNGDGREETCTSKCLMHLHVPGKFGPSTRGGGPWETSLTRLWQCREWQNLLSTLCPLWSRSRGSCHWSSSQEEIRAWTWICHSLDLSQVSSTAIAQLQLWRMCLVDVLSQTKLMGMLLARKKKNQSIIHIFFQSPC